MRSILHCDLNNFFASVEMLKRPELRHVPMAVSGDPNKRHGIILAKNQIAKKYGIYTPETVYSALKKCPNLVLIEPHYQEYVKYSKLVNEIYQKYTDKVEKFGIDESFLDVTESTNIFGTPYEIAYKIKEEIKHKFGLTISVGVSFNKSLAKLGSDLKKPDAITVLDYATYKSKIYDLPVEMLLYVGKNTQVKLNKLGIKTIGDLAKSNRNRIVSHLGKLGEQIYNYANGHDEERVKFFYEKEERKSISQGVTFEKDIEDKRKLENQIRIISSNIARKLRNINMKCSVVGISLKDNMLVTTSRQKKIEYTNSYQMIANIACEILEQNYLIGKKIRALTVFTSNLKNEDDIDQIDLFSIIENNKQDIKNDFNTSKDNVTRILDSLSEKYGSDKVNFGSAVRIDKNQKNNIDKFLS